ncbi:MAG: NADH-quinone oxidoreductase subunit H [Sulfolobales archaeon]|nr:NADH-quinone oxidoreductase subunit H [Sulfolobales archaeon]MCX8198852.1 NADH-quinone oxidoreductase subunit H [Sulfolobales archaeon]MDW8170750.1 complex I subunit 1 family protein [Desulfurococcaceae archaeon]
MIIELMISTLVFPGVLFISALSFFTEWYLRKGVAHMQSRMGPTYVGPIGLLQPFMDFVKLLVVKEETKQKYSLTWLAELFGVLGISAIVSSLLLLPLSPIRIAADYDFLIYIYLLGVMVPIAMVAMSLCMSNPFVSVGASRLLSIVLIVEPAFFTGMLTPILIATHISSSAPMFCEEAYCKLPLYSIFYSSITIGSAWSNPIYATALIIGLAAVVVSVQAKAMLNPFNIPEAEQELIAGIKTEFSGPLLAIFNLLHNVELSSSILFIIYVFLGGPYPFRHLSIQGVLVLMAKYIAILTLVAVVRALFGRFRVEQGVWILVKYSLIPAIAAITIVSLSNFYA